MGGTELHGYIGKSGVVRSYSSYELLFGFYTAPCYYAPAVLVEDMIFAVTATVGRHAKQRSSRRSTTTRRRLLMPQGRGNQALRHRAAQQDSCYQRDAVHHGWFFFLSALYKDG
jgi:hypothetical protein